MSDYIDKITDKDTGESRIISPAAEDVRVDNENFEGANLDEVLDEVAHAIDEAGSGDGTVTGVKVGETTYEPTEGVVDLSTPIGNKVDKVTGKGLSKNDYTDTDKAKVDGLKPVATSGSYTDLTDKPTIPTVPTMDSTPTAGNTTHMVSSDGVASALNNLLTNLRIVNGEWYIGNTATGVSAQGPQGSCAITGDGSNIISIIVNNLVTGGAGNILSAEQGKVLKGKIDEVQANVVNLYNRLGNMAFWSAADKAAAEPAELDWSIAKVTVTVTNNIGANIAVIKRYGQAVSGSVMVDQGDSLTLTIDGADGYGLTAVFAAIDGGSATALTGVNGVFTLNVAQVNAAMSIVITGTYTQTIPISVTTDSNCSVASGSASGVLSGQSANIIVECATDYGIKASGVQVDGGTVGTITHNGQLYTIPVTHDGTSQSISVSVAATESIPYEVPEGGELVFWLDGLDVKAGDTKWVDKINGWEMEKAGGSSDSLTSPDPTNHCWSFLNNYNQPGKGLYATNKASAFSRADHTIEVVYKRTAWTAGDGNNTADRAAVATFWSIWNNTITARNIGVLAATGSAGKQLVGSDAGGITNGVWDMDNDCDVFYCVGMNNDNAVHNGAALSVKLDASNQVVTNTFSSQDTSPNGPICIGCYSAGNSAGDKYSAFKGIILAVRVYSGKLTAAQMLANQKVDNERYGLGLTLPESVQSNS